MASKSKKLSSADLIKSIASELDCSEKLTRQFIGTFLETLIHSVLKEEGSLTFKGFGTFSCKKREGRDGRNPATGESIKIEASKTVGFKCSVKEKK